MKRLKCDYCNRILLSDQTASFKCTACGHGKMKEMKPKAYCKECGKPIFDNIEAGTEVICGICLSKKVAKVESLEKRFEKRIMGMRLDTEKEKKNKPLGVIRNKEDYELALQFEKEAMDRVVGEAREYMDRIMIGKVLEKARKRRGISQKTLAVYLEVSPGYLCQQEKGLIPLTTKALDFINDGFKWQNKEK